MARSQSEKPENSHQPRQYDRSLLPAHGRRTEPAMDTRGANINVVVRLRPLNEKEQADGAPPRGPPVSAPRSRTCL